MTILEANLKNVPKNEDNLLTDNRPVKLGCHGHMLKGFPLTRGEAPGISISMCMCTAVLIYSAK